MYSKNRENGYGNGGMRPDPYHRTLYIPPNYRGMAMTAPPPSPDLPLSDPDTVTDDGDTALSADNTILSDAFSESSITHSESFQDIEAPPQPKLGSSLFSGNGFPFGHGLGYEELFLLGLMLFLMREGESEEDKTLSLLILGALLVLG